MSIAPPLLSILKRKLLPFADKPKNYQMNTSKIPTWFWIVSVLALLWNGMGVFAFISDFNMSPEKLSAFTVEQQAVLAEYPSWTKIFYGLATIAGFLGCVGLLMRRSWAVPMFFASLIGIIVQQGHSIFMTRALEVFGTATALVFPAVILVAAIVLLFFARSARGKGWLT